METQIVKAAHSSEQQSINVSNLLSESGVSCRSINSATVVRIDHHASAYGSGFLSPPFAYLAPSQVNPPGVSDCVSGSSTSAASFSCSVNAPLFIYTVEVYGLRNRRNARSRRPCLLLASQTWHRDARYLCRFQAGPNCDASIIRVTGISYLSRIVLLKTDVLHISWAFGINSG